MPDVDVTITVASGPIVERGSVTRVASDPPAPYDGQVWFNTTDGVWRSYDGSVVRTVAEREWVKALGYSTLVGDGVETDFTVTHNLDASCVIWQLRDSATGEKVEAAEYYTSVDAVQLVFDSPPDVDAIHFSAIGVPA